MTAVGGERRFHDVRHESGLPLTPDVLRRRGGSASSATVVRTIPSMTRATIVVFGSRSEGFRLRGASRYPMCAGSVLRSCLDPPRRSARTSAADLRSNRQGTDYRVDPL